MPRDYVVFSADGMYAPWTFSETVEVDLWPDIQASIGARSLTIPPGTYSLTVIIDPDGRISEGSELNNRLTSRTQFFYPGTAPESAFAVDIAYRGSGTLNEANPLKLFIGDASSSIYLNEHWARFVVTSEGRYFLPVEDLPHRDTDGSGYILIVVQDAQNDQERPVFLGAGDVGAIYRGGSTSLSYGVFEVSCGTAIYPGQSYRIDFSPPKPPSADAYEVDDWREAGTIIDYTELPVRQRHTFHDEGTGDTDQDWFRIALGAGDTLTVETSTAGGEWECDTAIDIADFRKYIRTGKDKSERDMYSRIDYVNDTGMKQEYFFLVKP